MDTNERKIDGLVDLIEMEKEFKEKFDKEKRVQTMFRAVLDNLPEHLIATRICEHVAYADCLIELKTIDLQSAYELMEKSGTLSQFRVKDSCLSFRPEKFVGEDMFKKAENVECEVELIAPYRYEFEKLRQYPQHQTFVFYIESGGYIVEVNCRIENEPAKIDAKFTFDRQGNARREYCRLIGENSGHFTNTSTFWASQDNPNSFVLWSR